ncbi:Mpo1 family 2-hydroxy fatty acid dioxygenase [Legionella hackeliae]|uniref:Transmembrane protein n=1 Tax=Legionella hackeliae TaxID=449 RepID=A0A0A8UJZ4_LEGHA|nr:Mpo1-like protein [Legionella hackeliae]KTD12846.1 transmembrane protein [Legionella hackeliae]CEK09150.1 Transmembrane protein [Legionella hackeliae]STX49060.1 transmembrane protein [Legionella hackeliae]
MKSFIEQAQFYAEYHQKPITLYTHLVGVPLIIFSLMIFLGFFHLIVPGVMDTTLAEIATVILLIYYFLLNWRLALVLTPILFFLLWIAHLISWAGPTSFALWMFIVTFISGWVLQLGGHYIEGKRPALVDNVWQALIAPLYLTAEIFFKYGRMKKLETAIHGEPTPVPVNTVNASVEKPSADDTV